MDHGELALEADVLVFVHRQHLSTTRSTAPQRSGNCHKNFNRISLDGVISGACYERINTYRRSPGPVSVTTNETAEAMQQMTRSRKLAAEFAGTMILLATVIGSGIMAEKLAGGNVAIALLGNTIPTGAILVVLITALGPVSGAHFNPAVTLGFVLRRDIENSTAVLYVIVQCLGGLAGMMLAHAMFELEIIQISAHARTGPAQWISETVATFGLVATIFLAIRWRAESVAWMVGLYITAAYWFTASTSFANPAVTIARGFTDTFSGIRPADIPIFVIVQCIGAVLATLACRWLVSTNGGSEDS